MKYFGVLNKLFSLVSIISDRCKVFEKMERLPGPGRPLLKFNLTNDFPS